MVLFFGNGTQFFNEKIQVDIPVNAVDDPKRAATKEIARIQFKRNIVLLILGW